MGNPAFYDLFTLDSPDLLKKQKFFLDATKAYGHVAEIGAGTGNIALYLADHGRRVTCIEPSPEVLIALSQKVFQTSKYDKLVSIFPFYPQRVPEFVTFKCIIVPNVVQLIPSDIVRKTLLEKLHQMMEPAGKLIITFFGEGRFFKQAKTHDAERKVGEILYRRFTAYSPMSGKTKKQVKISWSFESLHNNKVIEKHDDHFICRCDTLATITSLLRDFKITNVWTDYEGAKFKEDVEEPKEFIVEAMKR
jgi:SAM-dependent methyltransferase